MYRSKGSEWTAGVLGTQDYESKVSKVEYKMSNNTLISLRGRELSLNRVSAQQKRDESKLVQSDQQQNDQGKYHRQWLFLIAGSVDWFALVHVCLVVKHQLKAGEGNK